MGQIREVVLCKNCLKHKDVREFRKLEAGKYTKYCSSCCYELAPTKRRKGGGRYTGSHRKCNYCIEVLPIDKFKFQNGYYSSRCKKCCYRVEKVDLISLILRNKKAECKQRQINFNLTKDSLPRIPKTCPVLGIELIPPRVKGSNRWEVASLDRINPKNGYTKGNVWWISQRANSMKSNYTIEELRKLITTLEGINGRA